MISYIQSPGIVYDFCIQGYLGIFRNIDAYSTTLISAQLGGRGDASSALFEIEKSVLIFGRKARFVFIFGLIIPFKM